MKIAPIHAELTRRNKNVILLHTGQHYDAKMSDIFFNQLGLPQPHYHLGIGGGSHTYQKANVMLKFEEVLLDEKPDLVLVVGSVNSSNSNRLKELAERQGVQSFLIDGAADLRSEWFTNVENIGLTAGASAPEKLVKDVIDAIALMSSELSLQELDGEPENMVFALPKELRLVQK